MLIDVAIAATVIVCIGYRYEVAVIARSVVSQGFSMNITMLVPIMNS